MTETMGRSFDLISGLAFGFGAVVIVASLVSALLTLLAVANAVL
ncbi:hypothetical protein ABMA46_21045 [Mesorhizobium sp. CN5-321]|jgi:hypothetical protein